MVRRRVVGNFVFELKVYFVIFANLYYPGPVLRKICCVENRLHILIYVALFCDSEQVTCKW